MAECKNTIEGERVGQTARLGQLTKIWGCEGIYRYHDKFVSDRT
jgi:hypothetical protein